MCRKINIFMPILFLVYILGSIIIGQVVIAAGIDLPFWAQGVLSEAILLLPAIGYVLVMKINVIKSIPYRKIKPVDAILSLFIGYALVPFVLLVSNISTLFATNHLEASQSELTSYPFIIQIIIMAIIPPLVEEFVFRGLFYHSYRKNGILGAAVLSGLVFGAFHLNINQFCYAFIMGIVFALMVEATGSMWSSIIAHFAVNTYSIIMIKLISLIAPAAMQEQASLSDYPMQVIVIELVVLAVFAAVFLGIAFLLFRLMAKRNGRWEYMKSNFSMGLKAQNGERFITMPALATLIVTFGVMIFLEI